MTYKLLNCYLCSVGSASYKCVRSSASYKCVRRFSLRRKVYGSLSASHFGPKQKLRDTFCVHFMHLVSILMLEAKFASEALFLDPTLTLPVSREILSINYFIIQLMHTT